MLYRKFGKTNEMVSVLGFGCMRLPVINNNPASIDEEKALPLVRQAIDSGVNYIDTAYPYHGTGFDRGGASEPFVGKVLQDGYREKVKLATKLPVWLTSTQADMERYLDEQLERLQTSCIDFYLLHSLNAKVWPQLKAAGFGEFLDRAVRQGKIKHAGFSFHDQIDLFKEIVDAYDWSFCQIQYNYLDETYQAGKAGLEYAAAKGLGIAIMEPLRGGNLTRLPEDALAVATTADIPRTPAEWALRWLWNHQEVAVVLSGMNERAQLEENVAIAAQAEAESLTAKEMAIIEEIKAVCKAKTKISCTACGYCMPCPAGINIPACFSAYNDYWLFDGTPSAKYMYQAWSRLGAPASTCVECGHCQQHCPQAIEIPARLKEVVAQFEE